MATLSTSHAGSTTAAVLARTESNVAVGEPDAWDLSASDVTCKPARNELWVAEAHSAMPRVRVFGLPGLEPRPDVFVELSGRMLAGTVLGLADIPHGDFAGHTYVLVDNEFRSGGVPDLWIGVVDDEGRVVDGTEFVQITDPLLAGARLASIDVNPEFEEIAAYDMDRGEVWLLSFEFEALAGPFCHVGDPGFFATRYTIGSPRSTAAGAGAGVAYSGPESLLVVAGLGGEFDTHLAIEHDISWESGLAYSGRVVDLSAATDTPALRPSSFVSIDTIAFDDPPAPPFEDVTNALIAVDFADEAVFAFEHTFAASASPVRIVRATVDTTTGQWEAAWGLDDDRGVDSLRVVQNGVEIATLDVDARVYTSDSPLVGRAAIEIVAANDAGQLSALRSRAVLDGAVMPPDFLDAAAPASASVSGYKASGCAVTSLPRSLGEFRAYVVGTESNHVRVLDSRLTPVGTFLPRPAVERDGDNLAAIDVALTRIGGAECLAILDPDGPDGDNVPSVTIHSLESNPPGELVRSIDSIDLTGLFPTPFLLDLDATPEGDFVAAGLLPDGTYSVVLLRYDGDNSITPAAQVPIPQHGLTVAEAPVVHAGVSVLPNGYLLVAASDAFSSTYTDALVMTPFDHGPLGAEPNELPQFTGFVAGLPSMAGATGSRSESGPGAISGFDTAWFGIASEDIAANGAAAAAAYVPIANLELVENDGTGERLLSTADLFLHGRIVESATAVGIAHPDAIAAPVLDRTFSLIAGEEEALLLEWPAELGSLWGGETVDWVVWLFNASPDTALAVEWSLVEAFPLSGSDGEALGGQAVIPPERFHRATAQGVTSPLDEIRLRNTSRDRGRVRVVVGARTIPGQPPPETPSLFLRGDCAGDGAVSVTDAIRVIMYLFLGGDTLPCPDACDANDDTAIDLSDSIALLNFLFLGGPFPPAPNPGACSVDTTDDDLGVCEHDAC